MRSRTAEKVGEKTGDACHSSAETEVLARWTGVSYPSGFPASLYAREQSDVKGSIVENPLSAWLFEVPDSSTADSSRNRAVDKNDLAGWWFTLKRACQPPRARTPLARN